MEKQAAKQNSSDPKQTDGESGFSYAVFLILLALVGILGIAGLTYYSFYSGLIVRSDNPSPIQFFIVNLFSLLILCAVVFQAFVYWQQWKQTRELFEMTERPSLGMEGEMEWGEDVLRPGEHFVAIVLKNSGKSPAVDVVAGISTGFAEGTAPPGDRCPEPQQGDLLGLESRNVVAIGGTTYLSSKNLTPTEFALIYKGRAQYFIWVHATYRKTLSQEKPFVFEMYSRYNAKNGTFAVCDTHNNAT